MHQFVAFFLASGNATWAAQIADFGLRVPLSPVQSLCGRPAIPPGPPHTGLGVNGAFFGECLYSLSTAHSHNIPKKLTFDEANDSGKERQHGDRDRALGISPAPGCTSEYLTRLTRTNVVSKLVKADICVCRRNLSEFRRARAGSGPYRVSCVCTPWPPGTPSEALGIVIAVKVS